jgi:hypothetical protein
MASINTSDDSISLYYEPDPSFKFYNGCAMNLLDRDYWNSKLEQRNYLNAPPPVFYLNHPQMTDLCNYRPQAPLLSTSEPSVSTCYPNSAQQYYERYLKSTTNPTMPVMDPKFCPQACLCQPYTPTKQSNSTDQVYPTYITTVKRNVDVESQLRSLDHFCPRDTADSRVNPANAQQCPSQDLQALWAQPVQNNTPMVWNNMTKMLNNYDQVETQVCIPR